MTVQSIPQKIRPWVRVDGSISKQMLEMVIAIYFDPRVLYMFLQAAVLELEPQLLGSWHHARPMMEETG